MPSASRLFALLYLFSPEEEEENGEKRKGKDATPAASPAARRLRRSEAGGKLIRYHQCERILSVAQGRHRPDTLGL